ncbi:hypothetical protein XI06_18605 [Bradyrhizobium sp. CCBAU 11434]|uniref:hypothetical protein n=1 Tax=Bradyrhizobium sp. CCBAU 11434 TaxID=1630885 RepID=UPI002306DCC1|nr:hypothetical protein [Bradyrhizobium sp. CCBAU 11434]MDA9522243.1 hypothetical protein [Bradyrhizobium sp. CCBAU 11434]
MRTLLMLVLLAMTTAAAAETLRLPSTEPSAKTLPLKGTGGTAKANACAAYGRGFTMVEGTCVKIGGTVSVDTVVRH